MLTRWLTVLLLAVISLGCKPRSKDDLVLLTPGGALRPAVDAAVAEFLKEHPGLRIKVISTPGKDYYKKSLTMLAGRTQVDLLWLGQGFGMFAGRGALLDLQPLIAADQEFSLAEYHPTVVDWYRYGEALYGVPYGINVMVMVYNLDLLERAGVKEPDLDWNVDDMVDTAEAVRDGLREVSGYERLMGLAFADLDYRYYGLSIFSDGDQRFGLNTPEGVVWLERNLDLIYRKRLLRRESDFGSLDGMTGFVNQQAVISPVITSSLPQVRAQARFRWEIVAVPKGVDGSRAAWASSSGFCIPKASQRPDLAWKLLRKLTDADFQRRTLQTEIPAIVALHEEYLSAQGGRPARMREMIRTLEFMDPLPRITAYPEVDAEWRYWKDMVLMQKIAPAEALAGAEREINRVLETHRSGGAQ